MVFANSPFTLTSLFTFLPFPFFLSSFSSLAASLFFLIISKTTRLNNAPSPIPIYIKYPLTKPYALLKTFLETLSALPIPSFTFSPAVSNNDIVTFSETEAFTPSGTTEGFMNLNAKNTPAPITIAISR